MKRSHFPSPGRTAVAIAAACAASACFFVLAATEGAPPTAPPATSPAAAGDSPPPAEPNPVPSTPLPERHLIPGVPYLTWDDAEKLRFDPKSFQNPSAAAAVGMVLGFWGQDLKLLEKGSDAMPRGEGGWARAEIRTAAGFDELKKWIARDVPVVISSAMVPEGQPLVWTGPFYVHFTGVERPRAIRTSGSLGDMFTPEAYRAVAKLHKVPLSLVDGRFFTGRVVIGYDDTKRTVTLHDPSFGPAWEVSREEFDAMWLLSQNSWVLLNPKTGPPARDAASPYTERTTDQRAAELYCRAYAASSQGHDDQAIRILDEGLALPGLSAGWRHLMLLERGCRLLVANKAVSAIPDLERARDIVPEDFRAWMFLSEAMRFLPDPPGPEQFEELARAKSNANALCRDPKSDSALAAALPGNLPFFGCRKALP